LKAALISYILGPSINLGTKGIRAKTVSPGAIYFKGSVLDVHKLEAEGACAAAVKKKFHEPFGARQKRSPQPWSFWPVLPRAPSAVQI
jgi:hypothetical protein